MSRTGGRGAQRASCGIHAGFDVLPRPHFQCARSHLLLHIGVEFVLSEEREELGLDIPFSSSCFHSSCASPCAIRKGAGLPVAGQLRLNFFAMSMVSEIQASLPQLTVEELQVVDVALRQQVPRASKFGLFSTMMLTASGLEEDQAGAAAEAFGLMEQARKTLRVILSAARSGWPTLGAWPQRCVRCSWSGCLLRTKITRWSRSFPTPPNHGTRNLRFDFVPLPRSWRFLHPRHVGRSGGQISATAWHTCSAQMGEIGAMIRKWLGLTAISTVVCARVETGAGWRRGLSLSSFATELFAATS